jgi:hypothetical protein
MAAAPLIAPKERPPEDEDVVPAKHWLSVTSSRSEHFELRFTPPSTASPVASSPFPLPS